MTPDAYKWPDLAAENTRLRQQIADLETEANTLAACVIHAATLIRPNRNGGNPNA